MKRVLVALFALTVAACSAETQDPSETTDEGLTTATTRYPIVLVHGFLGNGEGFASFAPSISEALEHDGHVVVRASLPPIGNVHQRATALAGEVDDVLRRTGAPKVNLIAHSMGGLDARELVSVLGYGDRVASVTTIATPHAGSRIADALETAARLFDRPTDDADLRGALRDLSESNAASFAASHPDDARVFYQSWAGVSSVLAIPNPEDAKACDGKLFAPKNEADLMNPILVPAAPIVGHGGESNDGFVRVASAKHGLFRGCVPADHGDEIGAFGKTAVTFDFVRFHRDIAEDLAKRGY